MFSDIIPVFGTASQILTAPKEQKEGGVSRNIIIRIILDAVIMYKFDYSLVRIIMGGDIIISAFKLYNSEKFIMEHTRKKLDMTDTFADDISKNESRRQITGNQSYTPNYGTHMHHPAASVSDVSDKRAYNMGYKTGNNETYTGALKRNNSKLNF